MGVADATGGNSPGTLPAVGHGEDDDGDRPPAPWPPETTTVSDPALQHHAISYIELAVSDMEAAKRFYTSAFDWAFNEYGPAYAGIRRPAGAEGEVGGLRHDADRTPGGAGSGAPLVILFSADLPATLERVRAAGGTITTDPFDFPGGRRFHFLDPSGNELAVWAEPVDAA